MTGFTASCAPFGGQAWRIVQVNGDYVTLRNGTSTNGLDDGYNESLDGNAAAEWLLVEAQPGDLRIADGSYSGRLEVLFNGESGTICDDFFQNSGTGATVACRQLGFKSGTRAAFATFPEGTGTIGLDNVSCTGNESSLDQCSNNGFGVHNCIHAEDVGIVCQ